MSGDSAPRTDTTTVPVMVNPEHGLGFNIGGGTDCPYVPGDTGIFITRTRKERLLSQVLNRARLLEVDSFSLIDVTHEQAVSIIQKAEEKRGEYVQLKFEKGALDKIERDQNEKTMVRFKVIDHILTLFQKNIRIIGLLVCLAGIYFLACKPEVLSNVENFIQRQLFIEIIKLIKIYTV